MRWCSPLRLLPLVFALGAGPAAVAHVGAPEGKLPFFDDAGALIGGATTWGVITDDGACVQRVCEEANGASSRWNVRNPDGRLLFGSRDGLYASWDHGCTSIPLAGPLDGVSVKLGAQTRDDPSRLFAVTTKGAGTDGLYLSEDFGSTWEATEATLDDTDFLSLAVSADGSTVFLSANDGTGPQLLVWTETAVALFDTWPDGIAQVNVVGTFTLDSGATGAAIVLIGDFAGSELWLIDENNTVLEDVGIFDGIVTAFVRAFGQDMITINRETYWHAPEGSVAEDYENPESLEAPSRCLVLAPDGQTAWGCGVPFSGGHFLSSTDGLTWTPVFDGPGLVERDCPEDTPGHIVCEDGLGLVPPEDQTCPLAEPIPGAPDAGPGEGDGDTGDGDGDTGPGDGDGDVNDAGLGDGDGDGRDPPPEDGCACAHTDGPQVPAGIALGLLALAWRRRQSCG